MTHLNVKKAQAPLRTQYQSSPDTAMVTDHARTGGTNPTDPYHSSVEPMPGCHVTVPIGVHRAVGGLHDAPTPGDMLCASLAACQDSTLRMIANILGIQLDYLSVEVTAQVDVRGTLLIDPEVPIGFQSMHCQVDMRAAEGTKPGLVTMLKETAQRCCVVQQTLHTPPPITTSFETLKELPEDLEGLASC
jgi:uncharacterized OsmC-like protein